MIALSPAPTTPPTTALLLGLIFFSDLGFFLFGVGFVDFFHQGNIDRTDHRFGFRHIARGGFELFQAEVGADQHRIGFNAHRHAVGLFDLADGFALLVDQEIGNGHRGLHQHFLGPPPRAFFFDVAQDGQAQIVVGPDQACAVAMGTRLCRGFQHARAQALTGHFHQTKARNTPHLNARAVGLQLFLHHLFDSRIVAAFFHVDEVDHDQPSQVAQTQLARHFGGGFQVGFQRGLFDGPFFCGPARVHVDGHQRFGDPDHQIPARFQLDCGIEHPVHEAFHLEAREQGLAVLVMLHVFGVRRHDHFHGVFGVAVSRVPFHQDFVNFAVVQITDGPFDQVAFFIDQRRGNGFQREFADLFPHALQVFIVALDFGLGALGPRRAHDQTRPIGHFDALGDVFQLLAVGGVGDLAADAAAARGVGHQHAVPARQRQVCGQGSALVAAFFFDHLHQHDLADFHHFLDFIASGPGFAHRAHVFGVVFLGHRFNIRVDGAVVVIVVGVIFVSTVLIGTVCISAILICSVHVRSIRRCGVDDRVVGLRVSGVV